LVVTVRLDGGALPTGLMVDGSFEALDLGALLDSSGDVVEEAVDLLGPGVFGLSRPEAFRVAVAKGGFASAVR
jgi:hypothetical protein